MQVEVRMFMEYRQYLPEDAVEGKTQVTVEEGITVDGLLTQLGIPLDEPKILVINGISHGACGSVPGHKLKDGDVVSIFPPVGGG